jgi:hypothetical protein
MADMITLVNTIIENGSTELQARIPKATTDNIAAIAAPIMNYQVVQNEFLNALVNKIALVLIQNRIARNPLAVLKNGSLPLGNDIQDIFVNMAKDQGYDGKGDKLLTVTTPDVKAAYHRLNRKGQYASTIYRTQLERAFTSYQELEAMVTGIVNSMYSGDNKDEFVLCKDTLADAINKGIAKNIEVTDVTDEASATALVKAIKTASSLFQFPSTNWNGWATFKEADALTPVETWCPKEDQILIIRADIATNIDVDVLAQAYNIDKATFTASMTLEVDNFGDNKQCLAMLIDKSFIRLFDNLMYMTDFFNPQGLYYNYWLNHWQTYSYAPFANAVAFCKPAEVPVP